MESGGWFWGFGWEWQWEGAADEEYHAGGQSGVCCFCEEWCCHGGGGESGFESAAGKEGEGAVVAERWREGEREWESVEAEHGEE